MRLKPLFLFPLFFVLGLVLVQCSTSSKKDSPENNKIAPLSNLTRGEADKRSKLISKTRYHLTFDLENDATAYNATVEIDFSLSSQTTTFLDFKAGDVQTFTINGKTKPAVYENYRIHLAKDDLLVGDNKVVIAFKQSYSKNGRGIYRFQDPEDKKVYIWTKLEPFDANQVFPCFDQPDLKATFAADITAPKDWKIVFATLPTQQVNKDQKTQWTFPPSPLMSSYLFSLHAGHYEVWQDKYKNIPLRLFVRASLKKYVDYKYWFSTTKKGFAFFEKEFDYPYPFKKYDQLMVPEFSTGGMENVAAVNYNERHIQRGPSSQEEMETLANIMLHEMAHMWFGDLVTMQWWDELWLNESFATFMAFNAVSKATDYKDAWMSFQRRGKMSAYIEDQYPTTHPISTDVPDINATFNHFDAITYSKGASSLRQLSYYLGEDNFRKGVQQYFKQYAFTNTTLPQFIGSLEKSSKTDLRTWSVAWLRNAGLDTLKVTPECIENKLTRIKFELTPPVATERPRPHRVPITLYSSNGGSLKTWSIDDWKTNGDSETREITKSMPCPEFILPNTTDVAYIKIALSTEQLQWAQKNLHKITNAQARGVFLNQAYLNLRDGRVKIDDFVKLFFAQYEKETHPVLVQQYFPYWTDIASYLPHRSNVEITVRNTIIDQIEKGFWKRITQTNDALWKKTLFTNWSRRVETEASQNILVDILNGKLSVKPLEVDQDMRWIMLQRLATMGHPKTDEMLASEKLKDTSENGFKAYLAAQASKPSLPEKMKLLEEMNRPDTNWSLARKQSVIFSLFPETPKQNDLRGEFREQFYKTMTTLNKRNEDLSYNRTYANLAPSSCDNGLIQEFENYINSQEWNVVTRKVLVIQNAENKICARIQSK